MGWAADSLHEGERREAWLAAKLAVRRYAREPSEANAGEVRSAWRRVRRSIAETTGGRAGQSLDRRR